MLMGRTVDITEIYRCIKHGKVFRATHCLTNNTADIAMKDHSFSSECITNVKVWSLNINLGIVKDQKTFSVEICSVSQVIGLNIYCYSVTLSKHVCFAAKSGTYFNIISL